MAVDAKRGSVILIAAAIAGAVERSNPRLLSYGSRVMLGEEDRWLRGLDHVIRILKFRCCGDLIDVRPAFARIGAERS